MLAGARSETEFLGLGGLLARLEQRLVQRAMDVALTNHSDQEHHADIGSLPVAARRPRVEAAAW